jgi:general secretion pathway protein L
MTSAVQATLEASRRFILWWGAELAELVPSRLRRWAAEGPKRSVLSVENGRLVHYEESRGRLVHHGEMDLQSEQASQYRRRLAIRRLSGRRGRSVGVRLPREACLIRRLELPAAARRDFDKILQLDLERATPFRQHDVYVDHFTEEGPGSDGKVWVRQVVVKRQILDPILQQLAAPGIKVDFADCWDDSNKKGLRINLLHARQGEPSRPRHGLRPVLILCLGILLLSCSAVVVGLNKYTNALERLEAETESAKDKALAVNSSLRAIEASLTGVAELRRLKTARPPVIRILAELTRLLPDSAWVTSLRIEGGALEVTIVAQSASELLPLLVRSPLFNAADLSAPVTYDPERRSERATVRMTLKPAAIPARSGADQESKG